MSEHPTSPTAFSGLFPKKEFQALTTEEVAQAMEQSKGAKDRLKRFNELLDDMLWKKNKLKQYKEKA
jgi:hypothetical protein